MSPTVPLSATPDPFPHSSAPQRTDWHQQGGDTPAQQGPVAAACGQREWNGLAKAVVPPPTQSSTPGPPHRLGGPFCRPLAPRGLLGAAALAGAWLPAPVLAARLHLPDVHPAVLAEGLPAVRQLGERGGWGETGVSRGSARARPGARAAPPPRAGQRPWDSHRGCRVRLPSTALQNHGIA